MDEWEMFPANITCKEMIGEGAFGTVFIATMDASVLIKSKYVKQHDGVPLAEDKNVKGKIVVVEIIGELPDKTSKKKNAKMKVSFINQPQINVGRQSSKDIIRNKPGLAKTAQHAKTPLEAFRLFFTVDMMENVVLNTNRRIENTISTIASSSHLNCKQMMTPTILSNTNTVLRT